MKGIRHITVSNRDAKFSFELKRNITIVRGDSGTGKTTLFDMIADLTRLGEKSGINISCDKKCVALIDTDWRNQLSNTTDSVVFIDEGFEEIRSAEFAGAVKNSDNYYVIFNRESLHDLPYSVEEIYEIKTSGKFHTFRKIYKSNDKHFYSLNGRYGNTKNIKILLTEDSHSGLQFFENILKDSEVKCFSSGANSAIFNWLSEHKDDKIFVIADGAAFGSEIDRVLKLQTSASSNFILCLPESFEWLILNSGLIKGEKIPEILENPSNYIESGEFFSWEKFFTDLLIKNTVGTPFQYSKSSINEIYLIEVNGRRIMGEIYPI